MSFEGKYNTKSPAVKRLMREAQELHEATEEYRAFPLEDNLFDWHFTMRGQPSSDFEGGIYHGRIILPPEYPMKPPNIILLTPNGRFEINKKICLSISGHHPETWQPSWSIRTALVALIAFMPTPGNETIGALDYSPEERQKLAKKSQSWVCDKCGKISDLLSKHNTGGNILDPTKATKNVDEPKIVTEPKAEEVPSTSSSKIKSPPVKHPVHISMEQSLRQRLVNPNLIGNSSHQKTETVASQSSLFSSSNDMIWSILIVLLVSAIVLLVLRRLLFV
ncbi:hypothetical protein HCN44_002805 [Aphidius gifuensis]|uniref:UBC core domain-containing protein n=1 Tax=Aphidius gifuensis TaxID=684658 RepID=A0A834XPU6_APHGI|nr:ubiquitin-conjugating enzyme E2 J1-like [Aphidius gifuensis]KAF7991243.1 hypothetical protein HCN44_002805 [Aphidius gifuensis]